MTASIEIPGRIDLQTGHGGLRYAALRCNGAEAHVYLYGAHVLHYQPANQAPVLWQSQLSLFEPGKPIRGGIPLCWPWFGPHPSDSTQPGHGIARLTEWKPGSSKATESATEITLRFPGSPVVDAALELTVILSDTLTVTMTTRNGGSAAIPLSIAMHTYFAVSDIHEVSVTGLENSRYIDMLLPGQPVLTQPGAITFTAQTERRYIGTEQTCTIVDPGLNRRIVIEKAGSRSTVVWNPWIEKAAAMPDFGNEEYLETVCVETANCGPDTLTLAPGATHAMTARIRAEAL